MGGNIEIFGKKNWVLKDTDMRHYYQKTAFLANFRLFSILSEPRCLRLKDWQDILHIYL
jgi:hypothetical protein